VLGGHQAQSHECVVGEPRVRIGQPPHRDRLVERAPKPFAEFRCRPALTHARGTGRTGRRGDRCGAADGGAGRADGEISIG
jgi:hypothetical protein